MNTQNIVLKLKEAGLRATPQRVAVLQVLEQSRTHLDADAIYQQAQLLDESISLATVYRTLSKFKEVGLVQQRFLTRDHSREYYERADKEEHYHFHCRECGKVVELHTNRIAQARRELSEALGLVFSSACICFEGYCPDCVPAAQQTAADIARSGG